MKSPLDRDDLTVIARGVIYGVMLILVAALAGLAIRVFLWSAFA